MFKIHIHIINIIKKIIKNHRYGIHVINISGKFTRIQFH